MFPLFPARPSTVPLPLPPCVSRTSPGALKLPSQPLPRTKLTSLPLRARPTKISNKESRSWKAPAFLCSFPQALLDDIGHSGDEFSIGGFSFSALTVLPTQRFKESQSPLDQVTSIRCRMARSTREAVVSKITASWGYRPFVGIFMAKLFCCLLGCIHYSKNGKRAQALMVAALISCSSLSENRILQSRSLARGYGGYLSIVGGLQVRSAAEQL